MTIKTDVARFHVHDELTAPEGSDRMLKTIAETGGSYAGLDRFAARARIVADLDALGLLASVEDRAIEIDDWDVEPDDPVVLLVEIGHGRTLSVMGYPAIPPCAGRTGGHGRPGPISAPPKGRRRH